MADHRVAVPVVLPEEGIAKETILAEMTAAKQGDAQWHAGRTFSLVYHAGDAHTELLQQAYNLFFAENALNPTAFASLRRFEVEVLSMGREILGGDPSEVTGSMTSGGTESILLAVKTYRDRARKERPEISTPEMIVPATVHPAFHKAAHYFDVKAVVVPVAADYRVDLQAVEKAITKDTILLVGSAPAYPHGVVDPIEELAALARDRGLGMHVDACVGGYLLPFVREVGYPVPPFDFRVPGVTSISADLHKYGFTAKGASTVFYRGESLRRHQYFLYTDWPGGLFASMTLLGTRPGGAIAAAWAAMRALGRSGYREIARSVMASATELIEGINGIPGLCVLGKPVASVLAYGPREEPGAPNIFAVADGMEGHGWHVDRLQSPSAIHMMLTPAHKDIPKRYLADLKEVVAHVKAHPELAHEGKAAMYGMAALLPDRSMVGAVLQQFLDDTYKV